MKTLKIIVSGIIGLYAAFVSAQGTTLTGTVTDSNFQEWAYATVTLALDGASGPPVSICASPLVNNVKITLNASGTFSGAGDTSALPNSCISPPNTKWKATICPVVSTSCQTVPSVTIPPTTYDMGTYISSFITLPTFQSFFGGFGYNLNEALNPQNGNTFLIVNGVDAGLNCYTPGAGWQTCSNNSGQITNTSCPSGASSNAQCFTGIPNDPTGGTALGLMACWNGQTYEQENIVTCAAATYGTDNPPSAVGVCVAGCGTTGTATIQYDGAVSWLQDTTVYFGQQLQLSTTVAGEGDCPNGALPGCIAPGEHTYQTFVAGRVLVGNTAPGTPAIVQLSPFTTSAYGPSGGNSYPFGSFAMLSAGNGSSFLQQSKWQQAASTFGAPYAWTGPGIAFENFTGGTNNPCNLIYGEGDGYSGNDISFDPFLTGNCHSMLELKGSVYSTPDVKTINGTVTQPTGGEFHPGASSNLHIWTLAGNSTIWSISQDNPGDLITFIIEPPTSGGPFTFTFGGSGNGFVNDPTISLSTTSVPVTVAFRYDGSKYVCEYGCASSLSGTLLAGTFVFTASASDSFTLPGVVGAVEDVGGSICVLTMQTPVTDSPLMYPPATNTVNIQHAATTDEGATVNVLCRQ